MSLFVLDTDHVSLLLRAHALVAARVLATPPNELAVSVITIEAGAVLVTRNRSDLEPIEGLAIEDWSRTE